MVTGGYYNDDRLDSTELLVPGSGSWRLATGLLPRPIAALRVATVANILYLTGNIVLSAANRLIDNHGEGPY